jgi:hypothetical protein
MNPSLTVQRHQQQEWSGVMVHGGARSFSMPRARSLPLTLRRVRLKAHANGYVCALDDIGSVLRHG